MEVSCGPVAAVHNCRHGLACLAMIGGASIVLLVAEKALIGPMAALPHCRESVMTEVPEPVPATA